MVSLLRHRAGQFSIRGVQSSGKQLQAVFFDEIEQLEGHAAGLLHA
jgi:hypothetical protein